MDSEETTAYSSDATIHAFSLDTIHGVDYKFEIDQLNNLIYNLLCNSYGTPLSLSASGIARRVMWYGGGGTGYVTLEFDYYDGSYHTVLSVSR